MSLAHTLRSFRVAAIATLLTALCPALVSAQTVATRDRIEKKTYEFKDAGRDQEYRIFVPSTYDTQKKTPLIVALHGLGGNPQQILGTRGFTDLAEERGYIVVAPYGYNERGWYGARATGGGRRGAAQAAGAPAATAPAQAGAVPAQAQAATPPAQAAGERRGRGGRGGGGNDPANLGELSEQDVLNVLEIVRKQYNIDADRTYLMGHSMGGGGTLYIGPKYGTNWAALAPFAPAIYSSPDALAGVKQIPIIVIQGDNDRLVPVAGTRRWVEKMKELGMTHEYIEVAGGDHMSVVAPNLVKMFDFFDHHKRGEAK